MKHFSSILVYLPAVESIFYRPGVDFPQKWGDFADIRVYDYTQKNAAPSEHYSTDGCG